MKLHAWMHGDDGDGGYIDDPWDTREQVIGTPLRVPSSLPVQERDSSPCKFWLMGRCPVQDRAAAVMSKRFAPGVLSLTPTSLDQDVIFSMTSLGSFQDEAVLRRKLCEPVGCGMTGTIECRQ